MEPISQETLKIMLFISGIVAFIACFMTIVKVVDKFKKMDLSKILIEIFVFGFLFCYGIYYTTYVNVAKHFALYFAVAMILIIIGNIIYQIISKSKDAKS